MSPSTTTTKDFTEITILTAFRIPLHRIERDSGICYFVFEENARSIGLIEAFWRGDLTGNIRDFIEAQRRVKDLIFRKNGDGYGRRENT